MTTPRASTGALTLGALGVVFGDIGTSPLYAIKESFHHTSTHHLAVTEANITGLLSLIFWSLILVICVKYLLFIMRANNHGEGGILALTALISDEKSDRGVVRWLILAGLFGAALLYGDGMITPAISVLSAVEGTKEVTESLDSWVIPISIAILVGLFAVQRRGTAAVGKAFGPIMLLWFIVLGVLGASSLVQSPEVLAAINPIEGLRFFGRNGADGFLVLGSVFLVVTGGEALYADMGHFGRQPITRAWYFAALPGLLLNYFGQGALLLRDPGAADSPFYKMAPRWGLLPLVILATVATVIASQALISGAFSLTKQAVQLGYLPRVRILQTSEDAQGQIYVPVINWVLLVGCVGLVIGFQSSSNLAAAYGLAVTGTMAITTLLFYRVATVHFGWPAVKVGALCAVFMAADAAFLGANIPKIPAGGWFPLVIGLMLMLALTTWFAGRAIMFKRIQSSSYTMAEFADVMKSGPAIRGPGVGVYLGSNADRIPQSLAAHFRHSRVLPESVCILSVQVENVPHVEREEQLHHEIGPGGVHRLAYRVGFMDTVDVPEILAERGPIVSDLDFSEATFVLGRETLKVTERPGMALWRERLFVLMVRNATTADSFFQLPPARTVEIGVQIEI